MATFAAIFNWLPLSSEKALGERPGLSRKRTQYGNGKTMIAGPGRSGLEHFP
jgi:hypothetical protein